MSIVSCPACGKHTSTHADTCPNCGHVHGVKDFPILRGTFSLLGRLLVRPGRIAKRLVWIFLVGLAMYAYHWWKTPAFIFPPRGYGMPEAARQRNMEYILDVFKHGQAEDSPCGYAMRSTGQWEVHPVYEECNSFYGSGLAAVKQDGLWGFIDKKGAVVVNPKFVRTHGFWRANYAAVAVAKSAPRRYKHNQEKYFLSSDLLWGFIDINGKWSVEPQFEDAGSFSEGVAPVKKDDRWGYINEDGYVVIALQFYMASEFERGAARVVRESPPEIWLRPVWNTIDRTGQILDENLDR